MRKLKLMSAMLVAAASLIVSPLFAAENQGTRTMQEAEMALKASVSAPDKGIPKEMLERAECVGVFPGVKKGAFIVGGEFGRGVFTCRGKDGLMGAPAFFTLGGPSLGWQFGGKEADLVLLIMNEQGVKHLLQDRFTLGGEVSAAAGPVGRDAQAATDAQMHAEILSWSRSRGLFLGASLEGTVIKQSKKEIEQFYGKPYTAAEILIEHKAQVPPAAASFVKTTTRATKRTS
jgi:SH3 domain-containing YSC84-like protein 1